MTGKAFLLGIISAGSLPLGALTISFWRPGNGMIAFLLAFGGGALLAALTIDLVASALAKGHYFYMAAGCLTGGFLFILLNQIINEKGGFLRKLSTTLNYMERQSRRKFRKILPHIKRIPVFRDLDQAETKELADSLICQEFPKGTILYEKSDPSSYLYIIEKGEVELRDPDDDMRIFSRLVPHDAFGRMAFFTGAPHATMAISVSDIKVWMLSKDAFHELLNHQHHLVGATEKFLITDEVAQYLRQRHHLEDLKIELWLTSAIQEIKNASRMTPAVKLVRKPNKLKFSVDKLCRAPIFDNLDTIDMEQLSTHVVFQKYKKGYTFFHQNDVADRIYIIKKGEVTLVDPDKKTKSAALLKNNDVFGVMSFLTNSRHTYTAVASKNTSVWTMRRSDFDAFLQESQNFKNNVINFIQHEKLGHYLQERKRLDPRKVVSWSKKAVARMASGHRIPSIADTERLLQEHSGAPIAIWLGIFLDGIPESVVIGATLLHSGVSLSLMAGLFLSNYPEALSSSAGMKQQGMPYGQILFMWTSLMVLTGVGAALGNIFFVSASPSLFSFVEGLAAGAMLTMIAETMLPEAYLKGGSIVGISTLLGFLAAIFFSTLH
jgi:CRP-like cAMP-binding protein